MNSSKKVDVQQMKKMMSLLLRKTRTILLQNNKIRAVKSACRIP
ncbi:hypothetical protein V8V71_19690 [Priestia megaterium]